jgi:hypothetical protein
MVSFLRSAGGVEQWFVDSAIGSAGDLEKTGLLIDYPPRFPCFLCANTTLSLLANLPACTGIISQLSFST